MRYNKRSFRKSRKPLAILSTVACLGFLGLNLLADEGDRNTAAIIPHTSNVSTFSNTINKYKNWGLFNQENGKSHINAPEAWKIEEGSHNVIVAVIDTGIDASHPDLAQNIWTDNSQNSNQKIHGWDFVNNTPNPVDTHNPGHGTHVAGIIGATINPKTGTSGVAHKISIMAVKYYSDANSGAVNLTNTVKAIHYAIDHGARIINYSGGGPEFSDDEYLAIKRAESKGILFISAAGNESHNTDIVGNQYYPSAYRLSNIISVAATDIQNNLLNSSNWGKNTVDVAAPGANIYSTLPGNKYGYMSGTSQATAFVTGLAALILSKNPSLSPAEVKKIIITSVDQLPNLKDKLISGGRVNAYAALKNLDGLRKKTNEKSATPLVATRPVQLIKVLAPSWN